MTQANLTGLDDGDTGPDLLDFLFGWQSALHTSHSGVARPTYVQSGMIWLDTSTTPWALKLYTGTVDVLLNEIDPTGASLDVLAQIGKRARFDAAQTLTGAEKAQILANIGAVGTSDTQVQVVSSPVSAIDFTIPATGGAFDLIAADVNYSASGALGVRVSFDGASFASGASDYLRTTILQNSSTLTGVSSNNDSIPLTSLAIVTAGIPIEFAGVFSPGAAANRPSMTGQTMFATTGPLLVQGQYSGQTIATGRAQKIRLLMSTGNITGGTFILRKIA